MKLRDVVLGTAVVISGIFAFNAITTHNMNKNIAAGTLPKGVSISQGLKDINTSNDYYTAKLKDMKASTKVTNTYLDKHSKLLTKLDDLHKVQNLQNNAYTSRTDSEPAKANDTSSTSKTPEGTMHSLLDGKITSIPEQANGGQQSLPYPGDTTSDSSSVEDSQVLTQDQQDTLNPAQKQHYDDQMASAGYSPDGIPNPVSR